ncbi:MAG: hypothetical protein V3T72_17975 [Thermoanaerobaculia bacterium]
MTRSIRSHQAAVLMAGAILLASPVLAGVVFQVETTYHSGSSRPPESSQMSVEGKNMKMEILSSGKSASGDRKDEVIFRGDRRQMVVVDHRDKAYMVIDGEMVQQIGGQVQQAMKQVEKSLEGLDPKQREMMEKMLKRGLGQAGAGAMPKRSSSEFRNTGERATRQGYPCVRWDVSRDGEKVRELWVTDWDNVRGGQQVVAAFQEMADFVGELMDSFSQMAGGGNFFDAGKNPIEDFTRVGGFPVVTRSFEGGELESETVLESATERDLDPDAFEPPKGYRLRTMGPQ